MSGKRVSFGVPASEETTTSSTQEQLGWLQAARALVAELLDPYLPDVLVNIVHQYMPGGIGAVYETEGGLRVVTDQYHQGLADPGTCPQPFQDGHVLAVDNSRARVYIIGGRLRGTFMFPGGISGAVCAFSTVSRSWRQLPALKQFRYRPSVGVYAGGRLLVSGGTKSVSMNPELVALRSCEVQDEHGEQWTELKQQLNHARYDHISVVCGRRVYIIGGGADGGPPPIEYIAGVGDDDVWTALGDETRLDATASRSIAVHLPNGRDIAVLMEHGNHVIFSTDTHTVTPWDDADERPPGWQGQRKPFLIDNVLRYQALGERQPHACGYGLRAEFNVQRDHDPHNHSVAFEY